MSAEPKREGKYLAKFGDGKAFPSNYGIYVEQSVNILDRDNFLVGGSYCLPGEEHETHVHPDHDEIIVFQNGIGVQTVGNEVYEVRDNDLVYMPAGVPHSIRNTSNQPLKMIIVKVNKGKVIQG
jgi:mannose-6-phosphate isomerase-like protein (cupin superfamily)